MSSDLIVIRFPEGEAEFDAGGSELSVGDKLHRRGREWRVAHVDQNTEGHVTITVMPAEVVRDDAWPMPFEPFPASLNPGSVAD